ncbi:phosphomannomutase/phosphoglucomutase [Helicobacter muridarum]|uniref:Phosphohexosemutase n=1 Tax=Helicobacter muridarum TaxID=216 RepID=A0A099TZ92_9HELI|nr:phosphomannomutase/phosphoglucomutase [Helicobacter muridarum]TLD99989.1 phosphomannomutase/phosphoglucomutase [Helicobacter muridarum]STQ87059.1 phosphohexosemutase [Helicobacter muridarum]
MSIFREYDIRGIFNQDLVQDIVCKIGYILGNIIKKYDSNVAIGYDARTHSTTLFDWLSSGFASADVQVYNLGMIPTPVAYFCTFTTDIKSSVMITGSHNPPEYNGFKITINQAPFYGKDIQDISKILNDVSFPIKQAKVIERFDILQNYIRFISDEFSCLKNWKERVVFDCGNGVASLALEGILQNLNIDSINLYFKPDGTFPNHHPDPSEDNNLADIKETLKQNNLHIGIAYDGDADRVGLVSQRHVFKGDELAILFANDISKTIPNPIIIGEVKCSQVMYDYINKIGKAVMYKTGHSNLKVKLKELNATLACEMSGHIFFNDRYFGYDDAIYASFRILELIYNADQETSCEYAIKPLEDMIFSLPRSYSTDEEKINTTEDKKFLIISNIQECLQSLKSNQSQDNLKIPLIKDIITIDGVRVIFPNGWGLIRASNTSPVIVTRFEAASMEDLAYYKDFLLDLLSQQQSRL